MVVGEDGGEKPADGRTGAETFRSCAYDLAFAGLFPTLSVGFEGRGKGPATSPEL